MGLRRPISTKRWRQKGSGRSGSKFLGRCAWFAPLSRNRHRFITIQFCDRQCGVGVCVCFNFGCVPNITPIGNYVTPARCNVNERKRRKRPRRWRWMWTLKFGLRPHPKRARKRDWVEIQPSRNSSWILILTALEIIGVNSIMVSVIRLFSETRRLITKSHFDKLGYSIELYQIQVSNAFLRFSLLPLRTPGCLFPSTFVHFAFYRPLFTPGNKFSHAELTLSAENKNNTPNANWSVGNAARIADQRHI